MTVYGVRLTVVRDDRVRVWRGRDPDLGTIRVEYAARVGGGPVDRWYVRRVSTWSSMSPAGRPEARRARAHVEVSGSGPDLAAALRALDEAEHLLRDQQIAPCLARRALAAAE